MKRVRFWFSLVGLIALGAILPSCGDRFDRSSTGPDADAGGLESEHGTETMPGHGRPAHDPPGRRVAAERTELVGCRPQSSLSTTLRKIGPAGGIISVGPYTLTVPAGALDSPVMISASVPRNASINVVQFGPDGLTFRVPALLAMTYANCILDPQRLLTGGLGSEESAPLRIAVVDDAYNVLYYLPSVQLTVTSVVVGTVEHFTNYAVAW